MYVCNIYNIGVPSSHELDLCRYICILTLCCMSTHTLEHISLAHRVAPSAGDLRCVWVCVCVHAHTTLTPAGDAHTHDTHTYIHIYIPN